MVRKTATRVATIVALAVTIAPASALAAKSRPVPGDFTAGLRTAPALSAARKSDEHRACLTQLPRTTFAKGTLARRVADRIVPVACEMPPRWEPIVPGLRGGMLGVLVGG
jgi:hypothetical protein